VDLRFSLLGPVRAWRGQAELDLGPRQQRAVLALLLLRANQLATVQDLIELLWGQDPPGSAVNIIHKHIGVIRRLLEPDLKARASGRWLIRHGGAYRLTADESMSDLMTFRRMVVDAHSARAANRPADALGLLMEAVSLRRGACSEGLELCGRHRDYFTAVDREYVAVVAETADTALESAQPLRVLPLLGHVAVGDSLNESLQARLMLVQAAAGQQALALAHYQAVRERLRDELGVDPGEELRTAYSRVLRQELPDAAGAVRPARVSRADPAFRAAPGSAPPGTLAPVVPPAQLPADLPTFAGREHELSKVAQMLSTERAAPTVAICVVDGMAGIGKTTFAIHWAHRVAEHFDDGQLYLNLRGFDPSGSPTAPAEALGTLLNSLGVSAEQIPEDLEARAGLYRSVLAGRRVLVVLDNASNAAQVRPLLPGSAGCLVIATSRNPLSGLAMTDGARLLTLDLPSPLTAREILERRLGSARVAAEPEAVQQIIQLCGRLPLALAIVSARAAAHPDFTLASMAADLRRTPGRLDAFGAAGIAADARTVFSWSYRHLSPQAGRLGRLLAQPPTSSITTAAGASLLGERPGLVSQLMAELTSTSLLTEHQPGRYSFHELTRAYAAELSDATDTPADRRQALGRLLDHYLQSSYAAQVELNPHRDRCYSRPGPPRSGVTPERFDDHESAMSWFTAERHVLNASVALAAESDFGFPAWQLALTIQQFYQWRGFFHDWKNTMEIALRAARRDADLPGQGHVLRSLAGACVYLGRPDEALGHLKQAQVAYTALGYRAEHAYLHSSLGQVFTRQGRLRLAIEHNQKALALYREAGNPRGEARAIADIGGAHSAIGDYPAAVSYLERGIALAQQVGKPHQEGKVRKDLGVVRSRLGQQDQAVEQLGQALALIRVAGDRPVEADTLVALGDALAAQGNQDAAGDAWRQASVIFSAFDHQGGASTSSCPLAEHDDLAAHHVTAAQGFQVLVDVLEPDLRDVVLDLARLGQREHLDQVQVVAPERAEIRQLHAHEGELPVLDAVAHQPDGGEHALGAQQVEPHRDRRLAADAVKDGVDRPAPGHSLQLVLDRLGRLVPDVDPVVGAVLLRDLELVVRAPERHHGRPAPEQLRVLDSVAPEPSDARHGERAARKELAGVPELLHRPERGHAGVRHRGQELR
jgi:DNA-binding SARP family transcriptional activator/tetratricopeptide (TPR) repeat protein